MPYIIAAFVTLVVISGVFLAYRFFKKMNLGPNRRKLDLQLTALTQQIRRTPQDPVLLTKRGIVRYRKRDLKGALADLDQAIEIEPGKADPHYHRARVLEAMGDIRGARKAFEWVHEHSEDPFYKTAVSNKLLTLKER